jgi:hypothetical protein
MATRYESATAFDETDGRDDRRHTSPVMMSVVLEGRYEIRSLLFEEGIRHRSPWHRCATGPIGLSIAHQFDE